MFIAAVARFCFGQVKQTSTRRFPLGVPRLTSVKLFSSTEKESNYEFIKTEKAGEKQNVGMIRLNRPQTWNALGKEFEVEITDALSEFDSDETVGAIVITGNEKVFAAGGDIKQLQMEQSFAQLYNKKFFGRWDRLGGGCELALVCNIIYAGENARFSLQEMKLGTIPGVGGFQRLTREIGKSKTMEMALSGSVMTAEEAERSGLVSKVFPPGQVVAEAIKLGERISVHSQLIVSMAKESVNAAYETRLQQGLRFERKLFCATFSTADQQEGMTAFVEKRVPKFINE